MASEEQPPQAPAVKKAKREEPWEKSLVSALAALAAEPGERAGAVSGIMKAHSKNKAVVAAGFGALCGMGGEPEPLLTAFNKWGAGEPEYCAPVIEFFTEITGAELAAFFGAKGTLLQCAEEHEQVSGGALDVLRSMGVTELSEEEAGTFRDVIDACASDPKSARSAADLLSNLKSMPADLVDGAINLLRLHVVCSCGVDAPAGCPTYVAAAGALTKAALEDGDAKKRIIESRIVRTIAKREDDASKALKDAVVAP